MRTVIVVMGLVLLSLTPPAMAEVIEFKCSWMQRSLITLSVDTALDTASSDDGKSYLVLKSFKFAVWLMVDDPEGIFGVLIHYIERAKPPNGGKWVSFLILNTGRVIDTDGGVCWEAAP